MKAGHEHEGANKYNTKMRVCSDTCSVGQIRTTVLVMFPTEHMVIKKAEAKILGR